MTVHIGKTTDDIIAKDSRASSVVKESYSSQGYLESEYRKLWPRVWQMACREEELTDVGDYVTYDIGDDSVIIVRSATDQLRAFHNVCLHRGRRLTEGTGKIDNIRCTFHGWRWDLDGNNRNVTFKEDWCGNLDNDDLHLGAVRLDTWGGFVFITFDPHAESLVDYLGEAAEALAPFQLEKMRYRWRKWLKVPANWKVALEAFNEGYHVSITHWPLNQFGTSRFSSRAAGKHGTFGAVASTLRSEAASEKLTEAGAGKPAIDAEQLSRTMAGFFRFLKANIDSNMTDSLMYAAQMLPATLPKDASPIDVMPTLMKSAMAIDAARGVQWPAITQEQYQRAGIDWHLFPNTVLLPMATNCLGYRARPDGDDPNTCIFEVYQLELLPESEVKKIENRRNDDIFDYDFWGEILLQDFQQMEATHRGMKSSGYKGPRLNPRQEASIENFHRVYHEYLDT
jgi:phenylpropionate dioxygenase-like ring-hydroxylating dioxygenase large terminal subunit